MEIEAGLLGVEEAQAKLAEFAAQEERALKDALEYILRQMCNYCKTNGPWKDQTGNLRNGISINIETMRVWKVSETKIAALETLKSQNETPVIIVEGDDYVGCLSSGMEYSLWVELKDGYWVLQGAIDKFEPLMEKYFADMMAVDKLDLVAAADIQYSKFLSRKGMSESEISQKISQKHTQYESK